MKIVIDIPEAVYDQICNEKLDGIIARAIRCGRPLPKGHGRLIDGDELASGCDEPYWCRWLSEIEDAPTIVPAEMEIGDTPTAKVNTPTDCVSRQAAIDTIMEEPSEVRYPVFYAEKIRQLPFAQPEQDGKVSFWKERAKEYEDIILRLVTEQAKGIKLDSIEITGERIIFKKSQPERKRGRWIAYEDEDGEHYGDKCSEWYVMPYGKTNFCPNCGADMREETDAE